MDAGGAFSALDRSNGSGQGLAIAHSVIVEKHRGTLTFDTVPGTGTTFYIRIPIEARSGTLEKAA